MLHCTRRENTFSLPAQGKLLAQGNMCLQSSMASACIVFLVSASLRSRLAASSLLEKRSVCFKFA